MKPLIKGQRIRAKTLLQVGAQVPPLTQQIVVPAGTRGVVHDVYAGYAVIDFEGLKDRFGIMNVPPMLDAMVTVIDNEPELLS